MDNDNNNRQYRLTSYLYIWLVAIILFTIIVVLIGYYNFPHCLFIAFQTDNTKFDIKQFTPAYPPPLVAFS